MGELNDRLKEDIRPLIDLIDTLRSKGVQKGLDLALPTIVVIGDQSSGKSSVLEALAGVALPRGTGMVTRCPLELKLRTAKDGIDWTATLSYKQTNVVSGQNHSPYILENITFRDPLLVEQHVKKAQNELAGEGAGISDELITLEIRSPDVCDLTLIDLPGITRVPVQGQPEDIGNQIKTLIMKFIRRPETLILVVVPCNIDIATTEALQMAQNVDLEGTRTIAVLTKPDLIDRGTEKGVLAIAQNKRIRLHKGYIMVKCRGQQQIDENISLEEALEMERVFFKKHKHFRRLLTDNKATISNLAKELTENLVDHIKKSLPMLDDEIRKQLLEIRKELNRIKDGPPQDPQGARQFLIKTFTGFNDKIKLLSSGDLIITDNLFTQLRKEYKKWSDQLNKTKSSFNHEARVKEQITRSRGRELAGFSSYRVFEMILQDHVDQFKDPAFILLRTIKEIIIRQFCAVSNECFQSYPALLRITRNKINHIQSSQQIKAEERIQEQFKMEKMIFTQDDIYFNSLNENEIERFSEVQLPFCDVATKYTEMLKAYNGIMVKRMSDHVPMLAQHFMLKKAADHLRNDMLTLMNEADVHQILSGSSDDSRRQRRDLLQSRRDSLNMAMEEISKCV